MAKQLFIDTETTGLDPIKNGILQISGMVVIDSVVREEFNFFCQPFPKDEISEEALDCNKITREQIKTFETPKEVYSKLIKILNRYVNRFNPKDKFIFIGYNPNFDSQFLTEWFNKLDDPYFWSYCFWPCMCVGQLALNYIGYEKRCEFEHFKLKNVAEYFGINVDNLHDGKFDIGVTKQIYDLCCGIKII